VVKKSNIELMTVITAQLVLDATEEYSLSAVKQLLLRERELAQFEDACARGLIQLEVRGMEYQG
jgi:hypothetical protein